MTTQQEVAEAFFRMENYPRRASNFEMVLTSESGQEAYLVGDGRAVFAKREPLNQLTHYPSSVHRRDANFELLGEDLSDVHRSTLRDQQSVVLRAVNEVDPIGDDNLNFNFTDQPPRHVDNIDALTDE